MAHTPHTPQGPEGNYDPAGSTQMFRAFVDDVEPQQQHQQQVATQGGPRVGLIVGVIAVVAVLAAVAWLALA
jgi:hypothetical protein